MFSQPAISFSGYVKNKKTEKTQTTCDLQRYPAESKVPPSPVMRVLGLPPLLLLCKYKNKFNVNMRMF